jgi:hypothetical protein
VVPTTIAAMTEIAIGMIVVTIVTAMTAIVTTVHVMTGTETTVVVSAPDLPAVLTTVAARRHAAITMTDARTVVATTNAVRSGTVQRKGLVQVQMPSGPVERKRLI